MVTVCYLFSTSLRRNETELRMPDNQPMYLTLCSTCLERRCCLEMPRTLAKVRLIRLGISDRKLSNSSSPVPLAIKNGLESRG